MQQEASAEPDTAKELKLFGDYDSRFIDAGGVRTHYVEAGDGPPLVLVHGGGAGADGISNFSANLPIFAKTHRTIALDMPGFGLTDAPDPDQYSYTQEARTRHLVAFIEAMGLTDIALIGNSMGGSTAGGAAMARPDLVKDLVLMGAAVNMSAEDMAKNKPNMAPVLAYDETKEGMRRIIDALTYDFTPSESLVDYRYDASLRPAYKAAYRAIMGWVRENGLCYDAAALGAIKSRTLVVAGKNDIMIPVQKIYELLGQIPHADGHIIAHCGHWVMCEYPELFCRLVLDFLDRG